MKHFKNVITFLTVLSLMVVMFTGCETEKIVKVEAFDSVNVVVLSDGLTVGNSVELTATAFVNSEYELGDLTFYWMAEEGALSADRGDTVIWTAPEADGSYTVEVHVSDGTNIGKGSASITVGEYVATDSLYYVGGDKCAGCHYDTYNEWSATGHASAWASLMSSDHYASYCYGCHTVDTEMKPGNGGHDEVPTSEFVNVQCENCHGPASGHIEMVGNTPTVTLDTENCTICHSGEHHPFSTDWEASAHNFDGSAHTSSSCQPCHTGTGFIAAHSPESGITFNADDPKNVNCAVCHDPHSTENEFQLRTLDPVTSVEANGTTFDIAVTGAGQLCVQCHHARTAVTNDYIVSGASRPGPHHSPQGDMLAGVSAYEDLGTGFTFGGKAAGHYKIEGGCTTCHMQTEEYPAAYTGHTFVPTTDACAKCHGEIEDFTDIMAADDYDGDGTVEGLQLEVEGLMASLQQELINLGLNDTLDVYSAIAAINKDSSDAAVKMRRGGYNYIFAMEDRSLGVHNPTYAIQMLQQSLAFLDSKSLKSAKILLGNEKAVVRF